MEYQKLERSFMEAAINEMKKAEWSPKVGAVLVVGEKIVSTGHKQVSVHAERAAIQAALDRGMCLKGAVLYTTLEPCVDSGREQAKACCADVIIQSGIQNVFIGRYDPHSTIYRKGWKRLRDAGIKCKDFPRDLREVVDAENSVFMNHFKVKTGPTGGAKSDHKDGATLRVQFSSEDHRYMEIGWTFCGAASAYGYAVPPVDVA